MEKPVYVLATAVPHNSLHYRSRTVSNKQHLSCTFPGTNFATDAVNCFNGQLFVIFAFIYKLSASFSAWIHKEQKTHAKFYADHSSHSTVMLT